MDYERGSAAGEWRPGREGAGGAVMGWFWRERVCVRSFGFVFGVGNGIGLLDIG